MSQVEQEERRKLLSRMARRLPEPRVSTQDRELLRRKDLLADEFEGLAQRVLSAQERWVEVNLLMGAQDFLHEEINALGDSFAWGFQGRRFTAQSALRLGLSVIDEALEKWAENPALPRLDLSEDEQAELAQARKVRDLLGAVVQSHGIYWALQSGGEA
jgi:hypothetical protein